MLIWFLKFSSSPILWNLKSLMTKLLSIFFFCYFYVTVNLMFNPLSANFTKWSNTLKQFVGNLATNYLSVFGHFVGLSLKGLNYFTVIFVLPVPRRKNYLKFVRIYHNFVVIKSADSQSDSKTKTSFFEGNCTTK